jgi:hypothetical protein
MLCKNTILSLYLMLSVHTFHFLLPLLLTLAFQTVVQIIYNGAYFLSLVKQNDEQFFLPYRLRLFIYQYVKDCGGQVYRAYISED